MKTSCERPSIWNVIVTIIAMSYLSCLTRALTSALYPSSEHNFIQNNEVIGTVGAFLGILIVFTWVFLFRDLIRQVSLFFRKKVQ